MIQYYTASSLDGFIATRDHSLEWLLTQDFDMDGPMAHPRFVDHVGALVMGSSTYEWLLKNQETWPYEQPTWVFTHRDLEVHPGADVRFSSGDVQGIQSDLAVAAGAQNIWVVGGGDLAGQFADAGLLDEVWVQFAPVTLGAGQPLLPRELHLELIDVVRNRDFACARYSVRSRLSDSSPQAKAD